MLNNVNMKNETLVKNKAWTKICKAKIYLEQKITEKNITYRNLKN